MTLGPPRPIGPAVLLERLRKVSDDPLLRSLPSRPIVDPLRPVAFRLARHIKLGDHLRHCLVEEAPASPEDDAGLDDTMLVTHQEWEQRLCQANFRREEQQQERAMVAEEAEVEHSTGIFGTIRSWASGLWTAVKRTIWG